MDVSGVSSAEMSSVEASTGVAFTGSSPVVCIIGGHQAATAARCASVSVAKGSAKSLSQNATTSFFVDEASVTASCVSPSSWGRLRLGAESYHRAYLTFAVVCSNNRDADLVSFRCACVNGNFSVL